MILFNNLECKTLNLFLIGLLIGLLVNVNAMAYQPLRVVSLSPNISEMVHHLITHARKRHDHHRAVLIGTVAYHNQPIYLKQIPNVGSASSINVAKILQLEPDYIFAWQKTVDRRALQRLRRFNMTVITLSFPSLKSISKGINKIGQHLNLKSSANTIARAYRHELASIKKKVKSASKDHSKNKIFVQLSTKPMFTIGNQGLINQVIQLCGGQNIFQGINKASFQIAPRSVINADPDFIINLAHQVKMIQKLTNSRWEKWHQIEAVEKKNIYAINPNYLAQPNTELMKGIRAVCSIIHPDHFTYHHSLSAIAKFPDKLIFD